jgi:hypothetical protein
LSIIFLDRRNELPAPSHRGEFDCASFSEGANGKDVSKSEGVGKSISEKKDGTIITKGKSWQKYIRKKDGTFITKAGKRAKSYQKLKRNYQLHFNTGQNKKKNRKVNMKRKAKLHLKKNRNRNMKENMNECNHGHESGDVCKER